MAASQGLIVLSSLPEARVLPSGLKATDRTLPECPLREAQAVLFSSAISSLAEGLRLRLQLSTSDVPVHRSPVRAAGMAFWPPNRLRSHWNRRPDSHRTIGPALQ